MIEIKLMEVPGDLVALLFIRSINWTIEKRRNVWISMIHFVCSSKVFPGCHLLAVSGAEAESEELPS